MIDAIIKINEAKLTGYGVQPDCTVWAGVNKSPQERERSSHAGKGRKMLHVMAPDFLCKTIWYRNIVGSRHHDLLCH